MSSEKKPLVHSHSALELYELCPKKFYHERIAKDFPFKENEQTKWGNEVHKQLEKAIKEGRSLDQRFTMYQDVVESIMKLKGLRYAEMKLGLNRHGEYTDFFAPDVYYRGVGDIVVDFGKRLFAGDWKTGKKKSGGLDMERMALLLFARLPNAEEIFTAFVWLQGKRSITSAVYTRESIPEIWNRIVEKTTDLEWAYANDKWVARENFLCRAWCEVTSCVFNGKNKQ